MPLYSVTTDSNGEYSMTFPQEYPAIPNVQAQLIGTTPNRQVFVTVSTTALTIKVVQQNTNTILGIINLVSSTSNVNGANVHLQVLET